MALPALRRVVRASVPKPARLSTRAISPLLLRLVALAVCFVGAFAFGYLRQVPAPSAFAADPIPPAAGDPRVALWNAASHLEDRLAPAGAGLSFSATQIQVLRPGPGGQTLYVQPDRDHPDATPYATDQILLGSLSGRGSAAGGDFYAEWYNGASTDGSPVFDGPVAYAALARDGALWRRDESSDAEGLGWVASSDIPGFGVDPVSLQSFPELLRRLDNVADLGTDSEGHHFSGTIDPL